MTIPDLPSDIGAEAATLGAVLLDGPALVEVADWLAEPMFYDARHGAIYEAMRAIDARKEPVDRRTVISELKRREQLEMIGGVGYLIKLIEAAPNPRRIATYARSVFDTYQQRKAIEIGGRIAELGYTQPDSAALTERMLSLVTEFATADTRGEPAPMDELTRLAREYYEQPESPGIPTGLYDYDHRTGGLRTGHLVVLAGRPAHGKSALAATIACNIAQDGHPVLFFSMEMDRIELALRYISITTGVDGTALQDRELDADALSFAWAALPQMATWPLYTEDVSVSLADIRAKVLRHTAKHGRLACVVVDYLQLVKPDDRYRGNRQMEVSAIARGLKDLAQEAQTTVLALSQMNRDIEDRGVKDPTPKLSDLRESGEIEQAANQLTFVVRPDEFGLKTIEVDGAEMPTENLGLLYVRKQRGRKPGVVKLRFNGACTRFENLVSYREVEGY